MTHPKEAIEAVAHVLSSEDFVIPILSHHLGRHQAEYRAKATAILDRISPMLVAAEREQCAKVADEWMKHWLNEASAATNPEMKRIYVAKKLSAQEAADSIRARSEGGEG